MPTPVKTIPFLKRKSTWLTAAVATVALAGGATFALWPTNYDKIVAELAQKSPEEVRKAVDSGQVPREVAWEAFGQAREAEMQKRVDGYFALKTDAERDRYLDQVISEMQARMREFERMSTTRPARPDSERRDRGPGTQPSEERRAEMERRRAERADKTPPAQRAQRVEFMAAMRKRMTERGIQMPGGMRGFGGGGGRQGGGAGRPG
jgi:hypothetical protein